MVFGICDALYDDRFIGGGGAGFLGREGGGGGAFFTPPPFDIPPADVGVQDPLSRNPPTGESSPRASGRSGVRW